MSNRGAAQLMIAPVEEQLKSGQNEIKNDMFRINVKLAYVINSCRRYHYLQAA